MMEINKIYNADAITAMKNSVGMQMIRHTRKQKALFRNSVLDAFSNAFVDSHRVAKNVIIGDTFVVLRIDRYSFCGNVMVSNHVQVAALDNEPGYYEQS